MFNGSIYYVLYLHILCFYFVRQNSKTGLVSNQLGYMYSNVVGEIPCPLHLVCVFAHAACRFLTRVHVCETIEIDKFIAIGVSSYLVNNLDNNTLRLTERKKH